MKDHHLLYWNITISNSRKKTKSQQLFIIFIVRKRLIALSFIHLFWDLLKYNLILSLWRDLQYRLKQIQHWLITEVNNAGMLYQQRSKVTIDVLNYRAWVQIKRDSHAELMKQSYLKLLNLFWRG